jgi:hypothetical protein
MLLSQISAMRPTRTGSKPRASAASPTISTTDRSSSPANVSSSDITPASMPHPPQPGWTPASAACHSTTRQPSHDGARPAAGSAATCFWPHENTTTTGGGATPGFRPPWPAAETRQRRASRPRQPWRHVRRAQSAVVTSPQRLTASGYAGAEAPTRPAPHPAPRTDCRAGAAVLRGSTAAPASRAQEKRRQGSRSAERTYGSAVADRRRRPRSGAARRARRRPADRRPVYTCWQAVVLAGHDSSCTSSAWITTPMPRSSGRMVASRTPCLLASMTA